MTRKSISLGVLIALVTLVNVRAVVLTGEPVSQTDAEPVVRSVNDFVTVWVYSDFPRRDLTAFIIDSGDDVITGGAFVYDGHLSAICDITGPDMRDILTLIESRGGLLTPKTLFTRWVYTSTSPSAMKSGAIGAGKEPAIISDLWPDAVWILRRPLVSPYESGFIPYMVPEPESVIFLSLGGWVIARYRRTRGK